MPQIIMTNTSETASAKYHSVYRIDHLCLTHLYRLPLLHLGEIRLVNVQVIECLLKALHRTFDYVIEQYFYERWEMRGGNGGRKRIQEMERQR